MIIELEDDYGDDDVSLDTDTASREELAAALIAVKKAHDTLDRNWDKLAATMTAAGVDFCETLNGVHGVITDREKAFAWFAAALTEANAEQAA